MRDKVFVFLMCVVFLSGYFVISYAKEDDKNVSVYLDDERVVFDTLPEIIEGRTMVPLRAIFEALDMKVEWDPLLFKVTAYKEGLNIQLLIGSDTPSVNGQIVKIDAKAYIQNERTMVPLRFIAESTGATVRWDSETWSVYIKTNPVVIESLTYKVVDTGLEDFFTDLSKSSGLSESSKFYGQDSHYEGHKANYTDNNDGTINDHVTGLMWQKTMDPKMTFDEAIQYAKSSAIGGYSDWRIPTIKELFSLILYTGESGGEHAGKLFIDTVYFDQPLGDVSIGEREIDAQVWSATKYVSTTMHGDATVFGVNFIDGRIKGYGLVKPKTRTDNKGYFRLVRGPTAYGINKFVDNGDGTISDLASGLMWQMFDDGQRRDWGDALNYSESLVLANHTDWRLPNIKELQSIVDYTKSLDTTDSPAISDLFKLTEITDPNGHKNFGQYWSSTTHQDGKNKSDSAAYVAFGEALGKMNGSIMDVHGAGAVRSDPKSGSSSSYPSYFGPQGDVRYVYNYVISVRTIDE